MESLRCVRHPQRQGCRSECWFLLRGGIHVIGELGQIRARLESVIHGNLLMVRGLTAVIATEPNIDQARFAAIKEVGYVAELVTE